ncbi:MAG: molybdopterin-dependent oxidoreductase [Halioglobus sp.]
MTDWKQSACILCECNCGIEVQLDDNEQHIVRIRGDKQHPASAGYLCQKASGLDLYQNGKDRITSPMRRKPDGSFETIDWDTAIREVSQRLLSVRDTYGGETIFYYGGGGQGNHLPGGYATGVRQVLGSRYRSNALAQEKTGEFWVNGKMFGTMVKGDFEHTDCAVFIGKNPWHSHGMPRARELLRHISKDDSRKMIVIDPVVTETAKLADVHLQVKPGKDAWLIASMIGVLVQDELFDAPWLEAHAENIEELCAFASNIPVSRYCEIAGVPEEKMREAVGCIVNAKGAAFFEDLGVQMNHHSTLVSYLEKLVWVLTGNFGNAGGQYVPSSLVNIAGSGKSSAKSPVAGANIISGLVPCNVIAGEILSDHPDRYRAMIVEAANPAHSLADSKQFARALDDLDTVVVIDVAMTETAKLADYVLPAATQYEKWEATFFNFEFPNNYFHMRKPLFERPENCLPEAEIHARLLEEMDAIPAGLLDELRAALKQSRADFRDAVMTALAQDPSLFALAPVILYRTLGEVLPEGAAAAAPLWAISQTFAMAEPESMQRAGHADADALFDAIVAGHSGVVFAVDEYANSWQRMGEGRRIKLLIPELMDELVGLGKHPSSPDDSAFPMVLSAGERRDYTANTIYRDAAWRRKDRDGALRINPSDATELGLADGELARIVTATGSAETVVEINARMQPGHVSLPNGFGLDNTGPDGVVRTGVAVNELTSAADCDPFAGTPWHKHVPARVEAIA